MSTTATRTATLLPSKEKPSERAQVLIVRLVVSSLLVLVGIYFGFHAFTRRGPVAPQSLRIRVPPGPAMKPSPAMEYLSGNAPNSSLTHPPTKASSSAFKLAECQDITLPGMEPPSHVLYPQAVPGMTLGLAYQELVYKPALAKRSASVRFLGWKADGSGLGNHIRGMLLAFELALISGRIFFVDDEVLSRYFFPPDGVAWTKQELSGLFPEAKAHLMGAWSTDLAVSKYSCALAFGNVSHMLDADPRSAWAVQHNAGTGGSSGLMGYNIAFANSPVTALGQAQSARQSQGLSWLLSRPSPVFLQVAQSARKELGLLTAPTIAIATRTFFDYAPLHKVSMENIDSYFAAITEAITTLVQEQQLSPETTTIFYTSDELKYKEMAKQQLARFGRLIISAHGVAHTASTQGVSPDMVDWTLLSEAKFAFVTGTSFHSAARLLNKTPGAETTLASVSADITAGNKYVIRMHRLPGPPAAVVDFCKRFKNQWAEMECSAFEHYGHPEFFDWRF